MRKFDLKGARRRRITVNKIKRWRSYKLLFDAKEKYKSQRILAD